MKILNQRKRLLKPSKLLIFENFSIYLCAVNGLYKRVLLKISGEFIRQGHSEATISHDLLKSFAQQVVAVRKLGTELAIVVGGGNIFRGHTYNGRNSGFIRADADKMGMLATAINAIAVCDTLEAQGIGSLLQSSIHIDGIARRFSLTDSEEALQSGKVIVFCCGTGNPFFSTDSAAALRACELRANILLKATSTDGIYDSDPHVNRAAKKFDHLSYQEALQRNLSVMDLTAFVLCMENSIPIRVFSGQDENNIFRAVSGEPIGTYIGENYGK